MNHAWESATTYSTLQELANASTIIVIGNVTSTKTVGVGSNPVVPVTIYNVTVSAVFRHEFAGGVVPGLVIPVGMVGGTIGNNTMTVAGYPTLTKGGTYILFLNPAGGIYTGNSRIDAGAGFLENYVDTTGDLELMTQGGPQGLYYVQGGMVCSIESIYPQTDAWLPIKLSGTPLAQFIEQLQTIVATLPK